MMIDRIRADIAHAYNSIYNTLNALLARGESLKSLSDKSDDLAMLALEMEVKGKIALEQAQQEARARRRIRNRALFLCVLILFSVFGMFYFTFLR